MRGPPSPQQGGTIPLAALAAQCQNASMSLLSLASRLARPVLLATDPETGHNLAVAALKTLEWPHDAKIVRI